MVLRGMAVALSSSCNHPRAMKIKADWEMAVVVLHDSSQNGAVRTRHTHGHSFLCLSLTLQLRGGLEVPRHSGNGKFSGDKSEMERGKREGDRRQTGDERHR